MSRPRLEELEPRFCPTNISFHGGPVLSSVQVAQVHFDGQQVALTDGAMGTILQQYLPFLTPFYNVGPGTLLASQSFAPLPGNPSNAAIIAFLSQEIQSGALPAPAPQRLYMLYLAPGQTVSDSWAGSAIAGYHSSFTLAGQVIPYAVCYALAPTDETQVECHELAESVSNPFGHGWYDTATGQEIADVYMWQYPFALGGYTMSAASGPTGQVILPAPVMTLPDFVALALTEAEALWLEDVAALLPPYRAAADALREQVADSVFAGTWPWALAVGEGEALFASALGHGG